jgi:hypothetical protein
MATDIRICLSRCQWELLESYLPEGICEKVADDEPSDPLEDCRIIANEATYRAILAVAKLRCPDLVQTIEKEKHQSDIEALPAQTPPAVPSLAETRGSAELEELASPIDADDWSRVRVPAILILTFVLIELCYLAFFAPCMPLLTASARCQRPSLASEPAVMDSAGVTWSTFLNATGFVFDIFSVYCLLVGRAVWHETTERSRSVRPAGTKLSKMASGSLEALAVFGVILLTIGLLLHVISLFV